MSRSHRHLRKPRNSFRKFTSKTTAGSVALENSSRTLTPAQAISSEITSTRSKPSKDQQLQGILDRVGLDRSPKAAKEPHRYHLQTKRPVINLLFVLPLILIYEIAALSFPNQALRSGMDQWLLHFFSRFGLGEIVILPLATAGILLTAHHQRRDNWKFSSTVFGWMLIESLGLGLLLFWAAKAVYLIYVDPFAVETMSATVGLQWGQTLALVGSGIYEELIFRLILLTFTTELLYKCWNSRQSRWLAILLVSVLFASLHYEPVNPAGPSLELTSFLFRCSASVIFSLLFLCRGFGIAVGVHIAFDILTQMA